MDSARPIMTSDRPPWVGLDLGTAWAKAALWGPDGERIAQARVAMPPVEGGLQDASGIWEAATQALCGLPLRGVVHLAITTQRDTILWIDAAGRPVSPLLSWRVRAALEDPVRRAELLAGWGVTDRPNDPEARPIPLEAWILECWTQGQKIGDGTLGRVIHAGGDKNCEYAALGVDPARSGVAALSLGSAIAMGMATPRSPAPSEAPPPLPPGVVANAGHTVSGAPVWHLETGILSGMDGLDLALSMAGLPPWSAGIIAAPSLPADGRPAAPQLRITPHFGGALDDPDALPRLFWEPAREDLDPDPDPAALTPEQVARAWAEGVVAELVRLQPRLEAAAGHPITELHVCGGGVETGDWGTWLGRGLGIPVHVHPDPWLGCAGAVRLAQAQTNAACASPDACPD
jgi:sugar (pentulose or hexulose) kinase